VHQDDGNVDNASRRCSCRQRAAAR